MNRLQQAWQHRSALWWRRVLVMMVGLWCVSVLAQQPVPALTARVMDTTGTLSAAQLQALDQRLQAFETARGAQVVVLLVASTQPEDIASYANRVANAWKIGRREIGDGLLLLVAIKDRKVRIEVAKTLEGAIPDLAAKRIIDSAITPAFKQGDYAGGIDTALNQITALIAGEKLPTPGDEPADDSVALNDLAVFLFFVLPLAAAVARRALGTVRGALATGGLAAALVYTVTSSLLIALGAAVVALMIALLWGSGAMRHGRGSGRSSSGGWAGGSGQNGGFGGGGLGGGGGFGSGGGGDFGGGGASGDW